jgi:hypothetical protein
VTYSEKPLEFLDGYLPAAAGLPIVPTVKAASLLAVLLAYAVGFAILYPIARANVSKGVSEGAAVMEVVGH